MVVLDKEKLLSLSSLNTEILKNAGLDYKILLKLQETERWKQLRLESGGAFSEHEHAAVDAYLEDRYQHNTGLNR